MKIHSFKFIIPDNLDFDFGQANFNVSNKTFELTFKKISDQGDITFQCQIIANWSKHFKRMVSKIAIIFVQICLEFMKLL